MLRRWFASTLARLPSQCAVCRAWQSQPLCAACLHRFTQPQPRCPRCALPLAAGAQQCGPCMKRPLPLDACLCAVDYRYPWTGVIAQFKFQQQPGWADALAQVMRNAPGVDTLLSAADSVLPMPLSTQRLRQRGFNQAHELARRLAPGRTQPGWLLRIRDTSPQLALDAPARQRNVRGAFALDPQRADRIRGQHVLLVDDVMTSGASLSSAAKALRTAGAARVSALVLARTPPPD
jgi:ComF family protein